MYLQPCTPQYLAMVAMYILQIEEYHTTVICRETIRTDPARVSTAFLNVEFPTITFSSYYRGIRSFVAEKRHTPINPENMTMFGVFLRMA